MKGFANVAFIKQKSCKPFNKGKISGRNDVTILIYAGFKTKKATYWCKIQFNNQNNQSDIKSLYQYAKHCVDTPAWLKAFSNKDRPQRLSS